MNTHVRSSILNTPSYPKCQLNLESIGKVYLDFDCTVAKNGKFT